MDAAKYKISFSCERASSFIPNWVEEFFPENDRLWQETERHDPYAQQLAEAWSEIAKAPLFLATLSAQVCDFDRSVRNPAIWSPWTSHIALPLKHRLLEEWYKPYREHLTSAINTQLTKGHQVLHISIRSCAVDDGVPLVNFQYSRTHAEEKHVTCAWQSVLRRTVQGLCLRRNSPKYGHADSLSAALRGHFNSIEFLSIGVHCSRVYEVTQQAQMLHEALKKVLHGMWR